MDTLRTTLNTLTSSLPIPPCYLLLTFLLLLLKHTLFFPTTPLTRANPPSLPDRIPFLTNTHLSLTNLPAFQSKVARFFARTGSNTLLYRLGPRKVYIVQGADNVAPLLRVTNDAGSEAFIVGILAQLDMNKSDIDKFRRDTSSRLKRKSPWSATPDGERVWYGLHRVYEEWMTRMRFSYSMAGRYAVDFERRVTSCAEEGGFAVGEGVEGGVFGFVKGAMGAASVVAMCGGRILERNPGFVELAWEFDEIAFYVLKGAPRWRDRRPFEVRDRFLGAIGRWLDEAWREFDWEGEDAESEWEEKFGSRFSREMVRWFLDQGMSMKSARGWMGFVIFALISNTIPITTWALYEIIRSPSLFASVRAEVLTAFVPSADGKPPTLDVPKLLSLPLLNSILIETLRLHLSLNLFRQVENPAGIVIDGYHIPKGCLVQAATRMAHRDEKTWSAEGHPASEFWAQRHVKSVVKNGDGEDERLIPEFDVAGKRGSFMPFGGGSGMCPGRFIAKQEILMTLATMVARFDVEFLGWETLDGKPSEREAGDDPRYDGTIATPPDREMKVRWKRLW
ncbi:cytochrome P450 [Podospora aff. communis PSN243]|uniref:Cytochrome P450 n=1 Tax=Podospora aff. communis PSN243 TaxID=3040156 RepID=A0AAV9G4M0_9PEZI|nr:cytochrome P450 [Podospora aff. communis PSN243]